MELTRRLATFIVSTSYEDLPRNIVASAKEHLLDTIGAMVAGRAGWVYAEELLSAMTYLGSGECKAIGPAGKLRWPAARAAMLNATFGHAIELDDGHTFAGVHAGTVVVAAALSIGAETNADGKEILTAIVLGYEVAYRLAVAQSPDLINKGFHPSATCDTVGAMAVAGKLMRLNEEQMANGLGLSALQAAGLMEATISGQQSKCIMVGNAAYSGIQCAYMAREGIEGTISAFEGKTGLFQAMSKALDADEVCKDLGRPFWITETYNKFYPTCRHSQPAIEVALHLADANGIDCGEIDKIQVGVYRVAYELTGIIHRPQDAGQAKFSIPYGVAVALSDHGVSVRHLARSAWEDERYLSLADRVEVHIQPELEALYPQKRGAEINIMMKDGWKYTGSCYDLKGSPANPAGFDELVKKFMTAATGLLSQTAIQNVLNRCADFEHESDLNSFLSLLTW